MYKVIKPNPCYRMDVDTLEIIRSDGRLLDLEISDGRIKIPLYGNVRWVDLEWLKWLVKYDITLPEKFMDRIFDLEFHKHGFQNYAIANDIVVTARIPIYYDDKQVYRIIPSHPDYVISEGGDIIAITPGIKTPIIYNTLYPCVYMYNRGNNKYITLRLHRLVAMAWVHNDDFISKPIVNHIDGNKSNYHATNLEWCSLSYNVKHAVNNNLRSDNYRVITRNVDTNEIVKHCSLTDASYFIGRARINTQHTPLKPGYLWKGKYGRFELKMLTDNTPWVYEDKPVEDLNRKQYRYTVVYKDGRTEIYNDLNTLSKVILNKPNTSTYVDVKNNVLKIDGVADIVCENITNTAEAYQAKNVITGEIYEHNTHKGLADLINVSKSTVTKAISSENKNKEYNSWLIRVKSDEPWVSNTVAAINKPIHFAIVRDDTRKVVFSVRQLANELCVDRRVLMKHFKYNTVLNNKNYTVTTL